MNNKPVNLVRKKPLPSQKLLLELLEYNPSTGLLFWKPRSASHFNPDVMCPDVCANRWNSKHAGKEVKSIVNTGYILLSINGSKYLAHRIIWKMVYGNDPIEIDHVDHVRSNNKLENLCALSHQQNQRNMKKSSSNSSGFTGVYWLESRSRWIAEILVSGKKVRLGSFTHKDDAISARKAGNEKYNFHENHGKEA